MDQLTHVPFDRIRYNPAINARGTSTSDVSEIAATILAKGFGQPMCLRPAGDIFEPVDGSRRFHALERLVQQGKLAADYPVPALIRELSDSEALELSLATAVTRLDLNPADEAEGFARLVKAGQSIAEIAATFGVPERRVKQRLAIANLPKQIVDALRKGRIGIDTAQAFTVSTDAKQQLALFNNGDTAPAYIRSQLMSKRMAATAREAKFVGIEAYRAAGGEVDEDLFSNMAWLRDGKLLTKLFNQKLKDTEAALLAEGWTFVIVDTETYGWKYDSWPRMTPEGKRSHSKEEKARIDHLRAEVKRLRKEMDAIEEAEGDQEPYDAAHDALQAADEELGALTAKTFTDAQKAKAGVIIKYGNYEIELRLGVMKPADARKPQKAKDKDKAAKTTSAGPASGVRNVEPDAETDFTAALNLEMAQAMTRAMQASIAGGKHVARLLTAVLVAATDNAAFPFAITADRQRCSPSDDTLNTLQTVLHPFKHSDGELQELPGIFDTMADMSEIFADIAAPVLASLFSLGGSIRPELKPMLDAFDPDVTQHWQATEEFFKRMPRDSLAAALGEAAIAGVTPSKKKKDLVEMALRHLAPLGWLPKPLRTPCYKGPGSNAWADAHAAATADSIAGQAAA